MNKIINSFNSHNILENQYIEYFNFLTKSIYENLKSFSVLVKKKDDIHVCYDDFFFLINEKTEISSNENPVVSLFVPIKYYFKKERLNFVYKINLFFGNFPLLTDLNSILIDSNEKQIVSQMIHDPVFSLNTIYDNNKVQYKAILFKNFNQDLVITCEKSLENKDDINFFIQKGLLKKIPLSLVLGSMGLTKQVLNSVLLKNTKEINHIFSSTNDFISSNFFTLKLTNFVLENFELDYTDTVNDVNEVSFVSKFLDFNLDLKTRTKLNEKLKLNIPTNCLFLTKLDFLFILKSLFDLINCEKEIDDLDDLANKSINNFNFTLNYFFEDFLKVLNVKLKKSLNILLFGKKEKKLSLAEQLLEEYIKEKKNEDEDELKTQIKDSKKKIKKIINEINNKFATCIDEFLMSSEMSLTQEDTNPLSIITQQHKILTLNKQEGNVNLPEEIRNIQPSTYGKLCVIETPEGQSSGLINNLTIFTLSNLFGFLETPFIKKDKNKKKINIDFFDTNVSANFDVEFDNFFSAKNEKMDIFEKDITLELKSFEFKTKNSGLYIPFSYFQFFSIACNTIPFLEHNDGNRILMGANMQRQALCLVKPQVPIVGTGLELHIAQSFPFAYSISSGIVEFSDYNKIIIRNKKNMLLVYYLNNLYNAESDNVVYEKCIVWPGETVSFGQILIEGFGVKDGELALGTNLNVAYLSWEGLNFEDSIVINENLILKDRLTSLQVKTTTVSFDNVDEFLDFSTFFVNQQDNFEFGTKINPFGIAKKYSFIKKNDPLLIFNNINADEITSIESDYEGLLYDIRIDSPLNYFDSSILEYDIIYSSFNVTFYILQFQKIQTGDKLAGRYGNKGVISKIMPDVDMPKLLDGTSMDIILNPLGIPSRMNLGQLFEGLLGLSGRLNKLNYNISSFDEIYEQGASRTLVLKKFDDTAKKLNKQNVMNKHLLFKNLLIDGRTNEIFDNPVFVTTSYIIKLFHLVDDKLTARTLGPKGLLTEQPLKGKSQDGGQRFGEMEVWAIEAYGASFTVQDILTLKSDDILLTEELEKLIEEDLPTDIVFASKTNIILQYEIRALGLDLDTTDINFDNSIICKNNFVSQNLKDNINIIS